MARPRKPLTHPSPPSLEGIVIPFNDPAELDRIAEAEVIAGDTLDGIARTTGTTVEAIVRLNPGIDPEALRVGQRVRVAP